MRKGKTRVSWVWEMRNNHYGVRKKARKHGKWGMKQDSVAWKCRTQNLVVTYTLNLRTNLEHILNLILGIIYIISKLKKSGAQCFKWCANQSWNEKVMTIWRQLRKVERAFRNDFEIQLMNSKWPQFWIHHSHFDVSPPLPRELHLGHSIRPKWTPDN